MYPPFIITSLAQLCFRAEATHTLVVVRWFKSSRCEDHLILSSIILGFF